MIPERIDRALGGFAQQGLELGEDLLDWIEVRGIGRQVTDTGSCSFNRLPHPIDLVAAQIVGDDDIAGLERGAQKVPHISQEYFSVHRAIDHQRSCQAILAQSGYERGGLPMPMRHGSDAALSSGRSPIAASHVGAGPSLIQEDQLRRIQGRLKGGLPFMPCLLHVGAILLAGVQGFF